MSAVSVNPSSVFGCSSRHDSLLPGNRGRAGLALSQDGKNWARFEATHHTAAILDAGAEGDWDESFIGSPQVPPTKHHVIKQ